MTDIIKRITSATSSFKPSGHSFSESVPQDTSTTGEVTTFTPVPHRDSHTTQVTITNTEIWTAPVSSDTTLGTSGGTSFSITSAIPQATSVVSTLGSPGGQLISPVTSTWPDTTSAISQSNKTQGTATTGKPHTTAPASLVVATTLVGTGTASSSTMNSQRTSGSTSQEMSTLDEIKSFSPTPSRESHTTQSTTELLSAATSDDIIPGTIGIMSVIVPSTVSAISSEVSTTGRLTRQSTPASPSASPQETSALPQMAQTQSTGTTRGSKTVSSVTQVTSQQSHLHSHQMCIHLHKPLPTLSHLQAPAQH